jgi:hypothetical protein
VETKPISDRRERQEHQGAGPQSRLHANYQTNRAAQPATRKSTNCTSQRTPEKKCRKTKHAQNLAHRQTQNKAKVIPQQEEAAELPTKEPIV